MTSLMEENMSRLRYRIYIKNELVGASAMMDGVRGHVLVFQENSEYRGLWMVVKDSMNKNKNSILMQIEGGAKAKSAAILPFTRS